VKVPTTVVYGARDSIVPPEQSRAVAAAAAGETRVVEIAGADHNDPALLDGEDLIEAVVQLAERVCKPPEPGMHHGTPRPSPPERRHYSCRGSCGGSVVLVDEATEPVATVDVVFERCLLSFDEFGRSELEGAMRPLAVVGA
jgi:hypothetical protein